MTQNQNNRLPMYLAIFILAAAAAAGWYYYYASIGEIQSLSADNHAELDKLSAVNQAEVLGLNKKLRGFQTTIDQLRADKTAIQGKIKSSENSREEEITKLQSRVDTLQVDRDAIQDKFESENKSQQEEITKLQSRVDMLRVDRDAIQDRFKSSNQSQQEEITKLQTSIVNQQATLKTLRETINTLGDEKVTLQLQLGSEKSAGLGLAEQLELAIAEKESSEARLQQKVSSAILTTAELEAELEKRQAEKKSLQEKMLSVSGEKSELLTQLEREQESKRNIANLKDRLEKELNESRVEISQLKNHMTVIKLTSEVLFSSGSDQISLKGKQVLSIIAESLNAYPDRAISVEGHTDNLPIRNASFQSNWELSVARGMAAVNYFQQKNQVDPGRLRVVGYGEFRPVASNETVTGRRLNRRIEIKLLAPEIMN